MIEQLLEIVAEGGIHSYEDLTKRLSVPQALLGTMLEHLARLGYLRAVEGGCQGHCSGCATGSCSITGPGQLWTLTEKGANAAIRLSS
jgi:DNA-binding IscR family transcriptional regulator